MTTKKEILGQLEAPKRPHNTNEKPLWQNLGGFLLKHKAEFMDYMEWVGIDEIVKYKGITLSGKEYSLILFDNPTKFVFHLFYSAVNLDSYYTPFVFIDKKKEQHDRQKIEYKSVQYNYNDIDIFINEIIYFDILALHYYIDNKGKIYTKSGEEISEQEFTKVLQFVTSCFIQFYDILKSFYIEKIEALGKEYKHYIYNAFYTKNSTYLYLSLLANDEDDLYFSYYMRLNFLDKNILNYSQTLTLLQSKAVSKLNDKAVIRRYLTRIKTAGTKELNKGIIKGMLNNGTIEKGIIYLEYIQQTNEQIPKNVFFKQLRGTKIEGKLLIYKRKFIQVEDITGDPVI